MAELEERRLELCRWNHQPYGLEDGTPVPDENFVPGDLRRTWKTVVERYRDTVGDEAPALLSACPPCQGMSTARTGIGKGDDLEDGEHDERNLLVQVIADVADALEPRLIVVENVPAFLTRHVPHPDGGEPVSAASLLCSRLDEAYDAFPFLTDLADYGVPQTRQRTFLTFVRSGFDALDRLRSQEVYPYPAPDDEQTKLGSFLDGRDFPELDAKEKTSGDDPMDEVPSWTDERHRMVKAISEPGGSAWENGCDENGCEDVEVGKDDVRCPNCGKVLPRPIVNKEGEKLRLIKGFRRSSYRRMPDDRPAPTITTASNRVGSNYTIHPYENRVLTPRECAALQTFPDDFRWKNGDGIHAIDEMGINEVRAVIGEAVPPLFTEKHGKVLRALLENEDDVNLIEAGDERCQKAVKKLEWQPSIFATG
jgi:DNA (cytosine-5)-methyltransferase 1